MCHVVTLQQTFLTSLADASERRNDKRARRQEMRARLCVFLQ